MEVVVVGGPRCGKTRFIRAFSDHHEPGDMWSHDGVRVYPCEYEINNSCGRVAIFEIPDFGDIYELLRAPHYDDADVIVFLYAVDFPICQELLINTWLPEVMDRFKSNLKRIVMVENKKDLLDDPDVLAIDMKLQLLLNCAKNYLYTTK